jgi:hypothetical protein
VPIKRIFLGADPACVVSRDAVDDPAALEHFVTLAAERALSNFTTLPDNCYIKVIRPRSREMGRFDEKLTLGINPTTIRQPASPVRR